MLKKFILMNLLCYNSVNATLNENMDYLHSHEGTAKQQQVTVTDSEISCNEDNVKIDIIEEKNIDFLIPSASTLINNLVYTDQINLLNNRLASTENSIARLDQQLLSAAKGGVGMLWILGANALVSTVLMGVNIYVPNQLISGSILFTISSGVSLGLLGKALWD